MEIFPPFNAPERWRPVDDRIRGGSSVSHLDPMKTEGFTGTRFWGDLDIKTLGGAGFASQVYTFDDPLKLSTSHFSGLKLSLLPRPSSSASTDVNESYSSGPHIPYEYTLVLKTGIPPLRSDGRKESTINYEYTFPYPVETSSSSQTTTSNDLHHEISWSQFEETYRGKPIKEGEDKFEPLDPARGITEISFMCRSGFGKQEGAFELFISSLRATEKKEHKQDQALEKQMERVTVSEKQTDLGSEKKGNESQAEAIYVPVEEQSEEDRSWMRVAFEMAEEALEAAEVPVGCVFVRNGEAIAKARNRTNEWRNATLHAELVSLDHIIQTLQLSPPLKDVTLYVTVEPCVMCASALRQVGIGKVIYGCGNERFGGCGSVLDVNSTSKITTQEGYQAYGGYFREEAILALRRFYITSNAKAPKPRNKASRVLKTEFLPIKTSRSGSPAPKTGD